MRSLLGDGVSRLPLYGPEDETGAATADQQAGADTGAAEAGEAQGVAEPRGDGQQRARTVRESVTDAIEALNKSDRRGSDGRFQRREAGAGAAAGDADKEAGQADAATGDIATAEQPKAAPVGWSKEAKTHWEALPPEVQAAVHKREIDMQAGVDKLKADMAAAKKLDEVVKPHLQAIQQAGVTPEVGVQRLLDWHEKLRADPPRRMAELMQVFGLDPFRPLLMRRDGQQQDQAGQAGKADQTGQAAAPAEIPAELKPLLDHLRPIIEATSKPLADQLKAVTDKIQGIESGFTQASQRQTQETVEKWGEAKPYFNDVRHIMREILVGAAQTNQAQRYLDANGRVDLDKLYDVAIYAIPEIRAKVFEEQQAAAEKERQAAAAAKVKAEREAAERARRASVSLRGGAPGTEQGRQGDAAKKGRTVRETIEAAMAEARDRGGTARV